MAKTPPEPRRGLSPLGQKPSALLMPEGNRPWFHPGGPVGCLLLHGFTGAPNEMRGLGEFLGQQGFTVLGVRLFGHGIDPLDMVRARWRDWCASVEDGYWLLRGSARKVVVLGLSMGSVLALELASRLPVNGVVAMSTPLFLPRDWRLRFAKVISLFVRTIAKGPPDWLDAEAGRFHIDYPSYPVRAIAELDALVEHTRGVLPRVVAPTLIVHSLTDANVPPRNAERLYESLGAPLREVLWLPRSGHVVTEDVERLRVWRACAEWVHRVCRDAPA